MKILWKVALLGWQDSLVYRFNALVWALYGITPSLTLMLVWRAVYSDSTIRPGGFNLSEMMTYYLFVTLLGVAITPNPEWDIATTIRDGKLTPFLLRPLSYFFYRMAWETSYQIVKTAMTLPAFALLWWIFREDIYLPPPDALRVAFFCLSVLGAYILLTQIKFLLGISAFWVLEPGGFLEIWNILNNLFAGRLLPLALLPGWAQILGSILPFSLLYAFPMEILLGRADLSAMAWGLLHQMVWIGVLTLVVRFTWQRGLWTYEATGV